MFVFWYISGPWEHSLHGRTKSLCPALELNKTSSNTGTATLSANSMPPFIHWSGPNSICSGPGAEGAPQHFTKGVTITAFIAQQCAVVARLQQSPALKSGSHSAVRELLPLSCDLSGWRRHFLLMERGVCESGRARNDSHAWVSDRSSISLYERAEAKVLERAPPNTPALPHLKVVTQQNKQTLCLPEIWQRFSDWPTQASAHTGE